jgi:curved DNA-binding protein CbpA
MSAIDHYSVLRIHRNASLSEIKAAYRSRAKEAYPRSEGQGDSREFMRIQAAYETLKDPALRASYDQTVPRTEIAIFVPAVSDPPHADSIPAFGVLSEQGREWAKSHWGRQRPDTLPGFSRLSQSDQSWLWYYWNKDNADASTPKSTASTPRTESAAPSPVKLTAYWQSDKDPSYSVSLSLQQAYTGVKVHLSKQKEVRCDICHGKGFRLVDGPKCNICQGTGRAGQRGFLGRVDGFHQHEPARETDDG